MIIIIKAIKIQGITTTIANNYNSIIIKLIPQDQYNVLAAKVKIIVVTNVGPYIQISETDIIDFNKLDAYKTKWQQINDNTLEVNLISITRNYENNYLNNHSVKSKVTSNNKNTKSIVEILSSLLTSINNNRFLKTIIINNLLWLFIIFSFYFFYLTFYQH